jgi:hypothetical protein
MIGSALVWLLVVLCEMCDESLLLKIKPASRYAGVSAERGYQLAVSGQWGRVLLLGRTWFVSRAAVEAWVLAMTAPEPELHVVEADERPLMSVPNSSRGARKRDRASSEEADSE